MSTIAIIPARGGSKGLVKKNIKPLLGKPLIYYTIKAAKESDLVDRVLVSTDSEEIRDIAISLGAEAPFLRPNSLATDTSTSESVLNHAISWLEKNDNDKVNIVVYLQCTDIFRKRGMIDNLVSKLVNNSDLDSAFVAFPTHKKFWSKNNLNYKRICSKIYSPRQSGESLLREDAGMACATRVDIIKQGHRIGDNVFILENEDEYSMIDIHSEKSFFIAEKVLEHEKNKGNLDYYY